MPAVNDPIFTLKDIIQTYNDKKALDIPRMEINTGSITGLMGPNGSGKSTLLKLLAFIAPPTRGTLLFDGDVHAPFSRTVRFNITLLTQSPYLLKRSVHDNITHGLKIRGKAYRRQLPEVRKQVATVMDQVGLPYAEFAHRMHDELSGGEAQRVAMAARLILKPRVLLLDEPTASVDVKSATLIRRAALLARKNWNTTVVVASHDREWLHSACDDLFQLYQGKRFQAGAQNIIPGPFSFKKRMGVYCRPTHTGRPFIVPRPPHENASAMLSSDHMHLALPSQTNAEKTFSKTGVVRREAGDTHSIEGEVVRLLHDRQKNLIIAGIRVTDLDFSIRLTPETVIREGLIPGTRVILSYQPDAVEWI